MDDDLKDAFARTSKIFLFLTVTPSPCCARPAGHVGDSDRAYSFRNAAYSAADKPGCAIPSRFRISSIIVFATGRTSLLFVD